MTHDRDDAATERRELLQTVATASLGFEELTDFQLDAAAAALDGRDVLAVLPTGSGKSAIYQLAGALCDGAVVVVSPLLALQRDQVAHIGERFGGAAVLNSTLDRSEHTAVLDALAEGAIRFVFLAPEQLTSERTRAQLLHAGIALLVVDEAHCIASWGRDFRHAYLSLGATREALGSPPVIALTATASAPVRAEIVAELRCPEPVVISDDVLRPEIALSVVTTKDLSAVDSSIEAMVAEREGTGLVYVATRAAAEELAEALQTDDRPALAYHAGLEDEAREAVERRFGEPAPVVVIATNAFGMGIDAPHVRFVIHREPPATLDDYYQEMGRAGRDGADAEAILVRNLDLASGRRMEGGATSLDPDLVRTAAHGLALTGGEGVAGDAIREELALSAARLALLLGRLQRTGAVEVDLLGGAVRWTGELAADVAADEVIAAEERAAQLARTQVAMMQAYLDTPSCRWAVLAAYFGDSAPASCGRCDRCEDRSTAAHEPAAPSGVPVGTIVVHERFGRGMVQGSDEGRLTLLFDESGYRILSADAIAEGGLQIVAQNGGKEPESAA